MLIKPDHSLKSLNTFGLDAQAHHFAAIRNAKNLQEVMATEVYQTARRMVLGGGSNILFISDFDGLILHNQLMGKTLVREDAQNVWLQVGGGENWHETVLFTLENGWQGLENLSLIPGTVGAAPIQNIGAYGVELTDFFAELEACNLQTGETRTFTHTDCRFGYRDSIFKRKLKGQFFILNVTFRLNKSPQLNTSYGAIGQTLAEWGIENPTPQQVSDAVVHIRQSKLPDPAVLGNCGSFFQNPALPNEQFEALRERFPQVPGYPLPEQNATKVAAGWLIEQAGWKGKRLGNVGMHEKQALVLVNHGSATGAEAYQLAMEVKASVAEKFGVELVPEVNLVGG